MPFACTRILGLPMLLVALLSLEACVSVPQSNYRTPERTVEAMQEALRDDDPGAYLTTLATETRAKHESLILLGWGQVRDALAALQGDVEVLKVENDVQVIGASAEEGAESPDWVWPAADQPCSRVRVRVSIDGEIVEEDFLFTRELDPQPANAEGDVFVRVGLDDEPAVLHDDPEDVQVDSRSDEERVNWRLIYPYYPYQRASQLAPKLAGVLGTEAGSGGR